MPVPLFDRVSEFRMFPTEMGALSDSQLVTLNPGLEYLGKGFESVSKEDRY